MHDFTMRNITVISSIINSRNFTAYIYAMQYSVQLPIAIGTHHIMMLGSHIFSFLLMCHKHNHHRYYKRQQSTVLIIH